MNELALFLMLAGCLGVLLGIGWFVLELRDRIEDLEDRADSHEAALMELNPGWMP